MKRLFTLLLISFAALSCEMIDEELDDSSVTTIANNQIWYTSTDGEIVEPYSEGENNYADALTTFGVNIVSNTYVDGKGVIEFDGDVTTIGHYAFYRCYSLTSVTIPDSVTAIGDYAFNSCSSLTSIIIPDSVTEIGEGAFAWGINLQEFKGKFTSEDGRCLIIDGVLNSFAPAGLTEYTILDSVTEIGGFAFEGCYNLTSVTIPDSVTTIGDGAFAWCSNLQEFKSKFASEDGRCLIIDGTLNAFAPAGLTEYAIIDSVTTIGRSAFAGCSSLTSVTIPDSVTTIGEDAFSGCISLTSVTIPDSVTSIGDFAFFGCSSLASVTIPYSVTTIGWSAFNHCYDLTSVTIPDSVTEIGWNAFANCISLTSVTIGDSITEIGAGVFEYCSSLTSVTIGDSVTTIGMDAFGNCSSLTSVTIPDIVTEIGWGAFENCTSLTSVYCKAITPPAGDDYMFSKNASGRKIYVPMESVEAYKSAEWWSVYKSSIVGYNF